MLVVCPSCGRHAFQHETSCPHCGQKGKPTLVALAAALGFVAACASNGAPAPEDTVVAVYGPPPIDPSARTEPPQQPTTEPSATTSAEPKVAPPPVEVYGPPPRDPNQRK